MISIHGTVTLASVPLATTASDGTFILSLLAHDHIGIGGKTAWRLTWCAPHDGHVSGSGSDIFCRRSKLWPQSAHWKA